MPREQRHLSGTEQMVILQEHLIKKVPISEVCENHGVQPTPFPVWQRRLFEERAAVNTSARSNEKERGL